MSDVSPTAAAATAATAAAAATGGGVSADTSRLSSKDNLKKAGEKFEAVFTGMMLKSMRQAKLADPLFDSKAIDTFSEMQDAQIAKTMAEHTPIGIGKAMTDFLAKAQASQEGASQEGASKDSRHQQDVNTGAVGPAG